MARSLEEYVSRLEEKDRDELEVDLEHLKQTLPSNDPVKIKEAQTRLEGSAYRIADAIYAQETPKN